MTQLRGPIFGLLAAVLFGVSPPLAKSLLGDGAPQLVAGLLYLGSGVGLSTILVVRRVAKPAREQRPRLGGREWWWLATAIAAGGIVAPVLLMTGLAHTEAAAASLMLNLEAVFTAFIAWFAFREGVNRRVATGFVLILLGGLALAWVRGAGLQFSAAALLIAGACACWAVDNNCTRKVSHADAVATAALKGAVAGIVNVALARGLGAHFPPAWPLAGAFALGFVSYGLSLVLFIVALRHVGAARTGAYFATAPFIGALVAAVFFGEKLGVNVWVAGFLMAIGVWLHLTESREDTAKAMEQAR
jgi:drug/metabolite transporter (DMT)-like permease